MVQDLAPWRWLIHGARLTAAYGGAKCGVEEGTNTPIYARMGWGEGFPLPQVQGELLGFYRSRIWEGEAQTERGRECWCGAAARRVAGAGISCLQEEIGFGATNFALSGVKEAEWETKMGGKGHNRSRRQ